MKFPQQDTSGEVLRAAALFSSPSAALKRQASSQWLEIQPSKQTPIW